MTGRAARRLAIAAGVLLTLAALAFFAFRFLLRDLQGHIAGALGPGATVGRVSLDTTAVELTDVVLPGGPGWPVAESLRAGHIRVVPSWGSLFGDEIQIARIEVDTIAASALRDRNGLRILPTLLDVPAPETAQPESGTRTAPMHVAIDSIEITNGTLDFYDATVARTPWKVHVTSLTASVSDVRIPALDGPLPIAVHGIIDGPQRDGKLAIDGWLVPATRDLALRLGLAAVDLLALQPYFVEATKASLSRGSLDLTIDAKVKAKHLHAPGHLVLSDLAFSSGTNARSRVLGVPRDLLIAGMQARGGRIALDFSLDGSIDDPAFSLNEAVSTRLAVALAKELGFSVGGLVEGTLGIGAEGLRGAGEAAEGVGSALKKLLPRR